MTEAELRTRKREAAFVGLFAVMASFLGVFWSINTGWAHELFLFQLLLYSGSLCLHLSTVSEREPKGTLSSMLKAMLIPFFVIVGLLLILAARIVFDPEWYS